MRKQVRIKRVYDDAAESDGTRVLVVALLGYLDASQER